jgi:hypothetical protein
MLILKKFVSWPEVVYVDENWIALFKVGFFALKNHSKIEKAVAWRVPSLKSSTSIYISPILHTVHSLITAELVHSLIKAKLDALKNTTLMLTL